MLSSPPIPKRTSLPASPLIDSFCLPPMMKSPVATAVESLFDGVGGDGSRVEFRGSLTSFQQGTIPARLRWCLRLRLVPQAPLVAKSGGTGWSVGGASGSVGGVSGSLVAQVGLVSQAGCWCLRLGCWCLRSVWCLRLGASVSGSALVAQLVGVSGSVGGSVGWLSRLSRRLTLVADRSVWCAQSGRSRRGPINLAGLPALASRR